MPLSLNQTTHRIIGAGMRVHRKVGPGLLESAYQLCFDWELKQSGLRLGSIQFRPERRHHTRRQWRSWPGGAGEHRGGRAGRARV